VNPAANFVAIDLGASSGRLAVGSWDGRKFEVQELHRFANGYINVEGHLKWDVADIWRERKAVLYVIVFDSESFISCTGQA
jgi:rhamnulokinase